MKRYGIYDEMRMTEETEGDYVEYEDVIKKVKELRHFISHWGNIFDSEDENRFIDDLLTKIDELFKDG